MNNKFTLRLYLFHFLIILFLISSSRLCNCQEKFLISNAELSGYELIDQYEFHWIISNKNEMHNTIRQKWHIVGKDLEQNIYIEYCEFSTELEAIRGTAYTANSNAEPFIWGSLSGHIEGDGTWVAIGDGALYLVRGNVGIMLFKPLNFQETERPAMESISAKIVNKIESNLSPEIVVFETAARQKQISIVSYQQITDPVVNSELMNGFSLYNTWDSKWVIEFDSITIGMRKEWRNGDGSIMGVDICQFDSDSVAAKAGNRHGGITYSRVFNLADLDSLKSILADWQNSWHTDFSKKLISIIGIKENFAVLVYQFDPVGIDTNFLFSIFEKLSMPFSNPKSNLRNII